MTLSFSTQLETLCEQDRSLINALSTNETNRAHLKKAILQKAVSLTWKPWPQVIEQFRDLFSCPQAFLDCHSGSITLNSEDELSGLQLNAVRQLAKALKPWKKGPFKLFDLEIDAEWKSQLKWDRLVPFLPELKAKRVLDIGCNNGYYSFKLLESDPALVLGIDPFQRPFLQFHLLQHFARDPRLAFQMWGWEEVGFMDPFFDVVFCMGIIYHHRDPFQVLKNVFRALKPGGLTVVETIVTPGQDSSCLVPKDRYASMRNVWFVPTVGAVESFLQRTGFKEIRCVSDVPHLPEEQRTTAWNPAPSYSDFLDPEDSGRTIEGYPAPRRAIFVALKP